MMVFNHISKLFKIQQKYSAVHHILNVLLHVWKCTQTRSFMFDTLFQITIGLISLLNFKLTELYYTFQVDTKFSSRETVMQLHEFSISSAYLAF